MEEVMLLQAAVTFSPSVNPYIESLNYDIRFTIKKTVICPKEIALDVLN